MATKRPVKAGRKTPPFKSNMTVFMGKIVDISRTAYTRVSTRPAMVVRPQLKFRDLWMTCVRLLAFGIIVAAVFFGALQKIFSVSTSEFVGKEVDADLKLAFLGFFNKSLDVLLVGSLEYTASLLLTVWLARNRASTIKEPAHGATFADFGLKDELTKPWMTILSFATRCRRSKWSWSSLLRCLLCLCISVSVMLQGLAINTVAVPKKRWYPNYPFVNGWGPMRSQDKMMMTIEHPKLLLQGVDWYNLLGTGQASVGTEGYPPWDWGLGLSASLSMVGLTHMVYTVSLPEKSWQHVYRMALDKDALTRWTALRTSFDLPNRPVETFSADDEQVTSVFNWLRDTHHQPTASSTGWTGNLTLVVPALNTICTATNSSAAEGSINVTVSDGTTSRISMDLGPVAALEFAGASCSSTLRQALYPVDIWVVDMAKADLSFNGYGHDWDKHLAYLPTIPSDYNIASMLATQTRDSLVSMKALMPAEGLLSQFLRMSRKLKEFDPAVKDDAAGFSIVMAVLLQNMLSMSNKIRAPLPSVLPSNHSERITSFPLQWQLYGSGPRLPWEWAAVAVLIIALMALCTSMYFSVRFWIAPGEWTELGGMMRLAQMSPPLEDIGDEAKARKRTYWVDKEGRGDLALRSRVG
ncbi:hypothetical protein K458DRAFT_388932 [Lentithecium fluviatile CBS 122367]|uniref:Uncharacterized protein n=1 Tax=Lentithecium fluviatile CBS 122367 TaxID=1168545 RepID=A0A6G1J1R1_9PLEO|nr:hypothetical protein K458DRAFT_388932 [Lentithecium fluviatile CBS 122367]